jgi:hypothetical protein
MIARAFNELIFYILHVQLCFVAIEEKESFDK